MYQKNLIFNVPNVEDLTKKEKLQLTSMQPRKNRAFGTSHALKAHKMHEISKCEICGQTLCKTFWLELHMSASHESLRKTNFIIQKISQARGNVIIELRAKAQ